MRRDNWGTTLPEEGTGTDALRTGANAETMGAESEPGADADADADTTIGHDAATVEKALAQIPKE